MVLRLADVFRPHSWEPGHMCSRGLTAVRHSRRMNGQAAPAPLRFRQLDVESQQVVLGQADSVDRRQSSDTGMRTMPVVAVHEDGQLSGSLFGVEIGAGIGPFT